jgi:hypothetical protein
VTAGGDVCCSQEKLLVAAVEQYDGKGNELNKQSDASLSIAKQREVARNVDTAMQHFAVDGTQRDAVDATG